MTYIYQYDTDFTIKPENIEEVYDALVAATRYNEVTPHWEGLRDVLTVWSFSFDEYDSEIGEIGINSLIYDGEKEGNGIDELFHILAPFVETGSQICFYDDNGEHFRYYFAHGMVFHQYGEVMFPEIPKIPGFWSMAPAMQKIILEQIERGVSDAQ